MLSNQLFIYTDGGARGNPGPAASGVVISTDDNQEEVLAKLTNFLGQSTNNEAEYDGFLLSLGWLTHADQADLLKKLTRVCWRLDSLLVVQQLQRVWKIKEPRLQKRAAEIWELLAQLPCEFVIEHIPRHKNSLADALVNQELDAH